MFDSKKYWEDRYVEGDNSGAGSYGRLAEYKASFLNSFVKKNRVKTILEFGSGDGNQLSLALYPAYLGLDVSTKSIEICKKMFKDNPSYGFAYYDPLNFHNTGAVLSADLVLSLDVIFHLVEDSVFEKYMNDIFNTSRRYVVVYASNTDNNKDAVDHVKHRKFTDYVALYFKDWHQVYTEDNPYPFSAEDPSNTSFARFFVFERNS